MDGQLSLYDALDIAPPPPVTPEPGTARPSAPAPPSGPSGGESPEDGGSASTVAAESAVATSVIAADEATPLLPPLLVEVKRSARRRKTAQAQLVASTLEIRIPASCSADEERYFVDHFRTKFERSRAAAMVDLDRRAADLATAHGLPAPSSIRWVSNQRQQWGSCTPSDGSIRLSDRMAGFPRWVIDYVIVHELAHLVHADHSREFWALVNRYPRTERARGYLLAKDGV